MNEMAIDVTLKSNKQDVILLANDLIPSQSPIPAGFDDQDTTFNLPNKLVYKSDNIYPTIQARICHTDYLDGDLKLVTVEVYPMQYYPKSKKIIYSNQFELKFETRKDDNSNGKKIHPKKRDKEIINLLKSLVVNPECVIRDSVSIINNYLPNTMSQVSATKSWNIPFYEYVIITSSALKTAFNDLVIWKRQKGYNAGIVSIEDIISDPMATGDDISNLNDNAGKLRQYLKAGYNAGISKYALLGGDYSIVPIRYGSGYSNNPSADSQIPSDLYFSDFNGNWNNNGNIYYGESYGDLVDYSSEIFIGRLLCTSESDVKTWTKKLLKYEQNPGDGNFSYLSRVLFTESDHLQQNVEAEYIKEHIPSFFYAGTKILKESPTYYDLYPNDPNGSTIISDINNNLYGMLCNFNHGGPLAYGTATYGNGLYGHDVHSNIVATDAFDMDDNILYSARPELGNGFDNLTNYDSPAIMYSVSCKNMPFDDFETPNGLRNLGEAFTCMYNGGGIAYLGNTRDGWVSTSYKLYKVFLDKLSITNNLGKAEALTKTDFSYGDHHWLSLGHNLLGCPETPMWTASPTIFNSATVSLNGSSLTVNSGVTGAKICVTSAADGGQSYYQVVENVSYYIFTNVPTSFIVVITENNYLPFIYKSDCYLQNETYTGTIKINALNLWVGSNVTTTMPSGPVVIQSGANVIIDADGDTNIVNDFEVQTGAQLEIK
jgi:hypothetical protein